MGYRHDRNEILEGAMDLVLIHGLQKLTFGRLAKELGINDRTIVYYFPNKEELVTAALTGFALRLQALLERAFGTAQLPPAEAAALAWPILASREADPTFAVYVEAIGLAAARAAPYATIVPMIIDAWIDWLTPHITGASRTERRTAALGVIAQLDGLLLLRHAAGHDVARQAARALAVAPNPVRRRTGRTNS